MSIKVNINSGNPNDIPPWTVEEKERLHKVLETVLKPPHRPKNEEKGQLKPHHYRELVNELRDLAVKYHDHQSLRERLSRVVSGYLDIKHSLNE